MPGSVIGKTLNYGYAGSVSRGADDIIENRLVKPTDTININFGDPVVLNTDNTYSKFGASNVAADFAGIGVREVKQALSYISSSSNIAYYAPGDPCDVLQRGSVTVVCNEGTPTAGGAVYVVTVAGTGAVSAVGDIIANATPAGTGSTAVQLTNVEWKTNKKDANNVAEITILTRNKA